MSTRKSTPRTTRNSRLAGMNLSRASVEPPVETISQPRRRIPSREVVRSNARQADSEVDGAGVGTVTFVRGQLGLLRMLPGTPNDDSTMGRMEGAGSDGADEADHQQADSGPVLPPMVEPVENNHNDGGDTRKPFVLGLVLKALLPVTWLVKATFGKICLATMSILHMHRELTKNHKSPLRKISAIVAVALLAVYYFRNELPWSRPFSNPFSFALLPKLPQTAVPLAIFKSLNFTLASSSSGWFHYTAEGESCGGDRKERQLYRASKRFMEPGKGHLADRIQNLEAAVDRFAFEVGPLWQDLSKGGWIQELVMATLQDSTPLGIEELVVLTHPQTGKPLIPDAFWKGARDLFILGGIQRSSDKNKVLPNLWNEFWIDHNRTVEIALDKTGTIKIPKGAFLAQVESEANSTWQEIEPNILTRLRRLYQHQGPIPFQECSSFSTMGSTTHQWCLTPVERKILFSLFDKVLSQHATDILHQPDYALYNSGGRIIHPLTLVQYPTLTWFGTFKNWIRSPPKPVIETPPEFAIQPEIHPGDCWAFPGHQAQISIRLARPVVVTSVSIEHGDPARQLEEGTAPRDMEVWSLPKDLPPIYRAYRWSLKDLLPQRDARLLATFQYDANVSDAGSGSVKKPLVQTFTVPLARQTKPAAAVTFRINSNWGHPNWTCLYRVRVHGYEVKRTRLD